MGWLVGAVALLFYNLLNALRTQIWLQRQRTTLPKKFRHNVESFFSAHGVKHIPNVWLINGMNQPFVWGLVRGSIYLPADLLNFQDSKSWASLLGHELSHVVRFDAIVHTLQIFAQVVFWFHPFVWWANRKIRMEREKCCDEMAIARLNALPEDYSEAIVEALAVKYESIRPVPSLAVAGPVKNIEERIKTMLRPGKKFYKHPSLVAATFVLLLALLTVPTALVLTARAETKPNAEAKEKSPTTPGPATAEGKAAATAALFRAIEPINVERMRLAITQGADLEAKNKDGCTPLYAAVARPGQNIAMIKLLLEAGANPNARDPRGQIPLHIAARHSIRGVELLVSAGSDVNARDKKGTGPAMIAFELGQTDMFALMVDHGATVSTDLMYAYKGNLSRVQSLIENGKAQETFEQGLTLLHAAAAGGHTAIVELLLRNGLDVYSETQSGYTALHHAAAGNHREVAELLLAKGANVDAETENPIGWSYTTPSFLLPDVHPEPANQTPLHWAIREGHKDMIEWLLARGANPNADGGDYHPLGSPLHWAIWGWDVDIAVLLVSHGGDIHNKTKNYPCTPLHDAVKFGHRAMVEALITKTGDTRAAKWAPLHATVASGDRQAVEDLLAKGADVNAKGEGGYTRGEGGLSALHVAAGKGHKDIAELLITRGADVDEKAKFDPLHHGGWTPLYFAICNHHSDVAELLLAKGADVNVKDGRNMMPLHLALYFGPIDLAELLVARDADVNARGTWGFAPLHIAAKKGHKAVAELLISKGVDVNAKTRDGKTPMSLAKEKRHKEIIELLRKHGAKE
jgi:ankyrin repeat protein